QMPRSRSRSWRSGKRAAKNLSAVLMVRSVAGYQGRGAGGDGVSYAGTGGVRRLVGGTQARLRRLNRLVTVIVARRRPPGAGDVLVSLIVRVGSQNRSRTTDRSPAGTTVGAARRRDSTPGRIRPRAEFLAAP